LHAYIFEESTSTLYVHHDVMLSSFPLCLEWLPYAPGSLTTGGTKANYVIVGSFLPEIEIWNLDELNGLEPEFTLGGTAETKKKSKKSKQTTVRCSGHF
jgi:periodic tryptophan protein 1